MKKLSDVMADLVLSPDDTFEVQAAKLELALDEAGYYIIPKSLWLRPDDDGNPNDVQ